MLIRKEQPQDQEYIVDAQNRWIPKDENNKDYRMVQRLERDNKIIEERATWPVRRL